jgi:signal peptide peptidase SppA
MLPLETQIQLLSSRENFAGVPFIDQYVGCWSIVEEHARLLLGRAENINLQLHLEQHATGEPQAVGGPPGGRGEELAVTRDGIAIVELRGTLMKQASSFSGGTSTVRARRLMRAAAASDDVTGCLLVIESPGGTVAGTHELAADIAAFASKKPCFAYIEDLGASAAYWFASQAQRISTGPASLVGSIGCFSAVVDLSKKAEQDGVKVHVVRFGKFKGAGTPGTEITEEQLAKWQRIVDAHGEDFVAAVARGRNLATDVVRALADGDIHKGAAAKQKSLVDAVESKEEAYAALVAQTRKSKTSPRSKAMSESPANAAAEISQPKAATLAELREHCVGASDSFLLGQLEKNATLAAAMKAHGAQLAKERDEALAEKQAAEAKAAELEKKPVATKRGAQPLAAGDGSEADANEQPWSLLGANEFAKAEIEKRVAAGQTRDRAVKAVFAAHEGLREAMVAEAPPRRGK